MRQEWEASYIALMSDVNTQSSFLREGQNSPMTGKPMGPFGRVLPSLSASGLQKKAAKKYAVAETIQTNQTIPSEATEMSLPFTLERFVML